jgi:hypothetical protein
MRYLQESTAKSEDVEALRPQRFGSDYIPTRASAMRAATGAAFHQHLEFRQQFGSAR